jgi:tetratricopeptide (TPR) repeat protein
VDTLTNKGPFSLAEELVRSVLELSALSPMWRARLLHQLGEVIRHQGRAAEAGRHLEDALAFARLAGDRTEEAATLDTLGNLESDVGRLDTAFAFYHDALAIHRANGAVRREATVLANLGLLHYRQGRLSEAHELILQAIAGHRSVNYLDGIGSSLSYLAMVLLRQGLPQQARQAFEESLVHHRQTAYAQGEVMVLINLGSLELDAGRQEEGRRYLREAAALAEKIGSRSQLGAALHNLGTSYKPEKEAEGYLRAALAIHRDIGNVEDEGVTLLGLAGYFMDRDELTAAGEHFGAALALFRKISLYSWEGDALLGLAWVSTRQGAPDEAREWLALAQQRLAETPSGMAGVEYVTGELLAREGRWDEARAHFTSVVATFRDLQDQVTVARALRNWARLEEEAGHTEQAAVLRSELPETT